ncbi:MAG: alpha/beta hydrolase [Deltaproteobacteria bacterium]|jgi:dienelactone hydrolase|nr:alpha/beta hydrolase [Deltaproteobacteria bacterium]
MEWIGDPASERGVREQRFDVLCEGRRVPGILWRPSDATELGPLVLLGHGGSLHKRADYILATARRLARHHGIASIAIDGPGHGDRRADGGLDPERVGAEFESSWQEPEATKKIVADWKAALDAVQSELGSGPVGYFGLSMGTMMGVPVIASETRVQVAVLGLMGVWGPNRTRLADDAARVRCPVRFLAQWDDEVVPRDRALDLFDRLGTQQKSLRAHPGKHVEVPADEMRAVADFLALHLG